MVLLCVLHMLRVIFYGAYKYPREVTWFTGVFLLLITLAFGVTGYLLPWDQKAYWATTVVTKIASVTPFIGGWVLEVMRGGESLSALTLARFYGARDREILALVRCAPALGRPLCTGNPDIAAQVIHAIEAEGARTLEDILLRRTGIGTSPCLGLDCVEEAARLAAPLWGWSSGELASRCIEYRRAVRGRFHGGLDRGRRPVHCEV